MSGIHLFQRRQKSASAVPRVEKGGNVGYCRHRYKLRARYMTSSRTSDVGTRSSLCLGLDPDSDWAINVFLLQVHMNMWQKGLVQVDTIAGCGEWQLGAYLQQVGSSMPN